MCRVTCLIRSLESAMSTIHSFNHWSGNWYVLLECWTSWSNSDLGGWHFQCTIYWFALAYDRKMVEQNLDIETTRNEDHYGAAIHHLSLLRNKRCLMAYMYKSASLFYADSTCIKLILVVFYLKTLYRTRYNRAEVIQSFRWKVGPVLPHDIQEKLHFSEKEYFKNHSAAIKSYISEMDIDLTVVWCFSISNVFLGMR